MNISMKLLRKGRPFSYYCTSSVLATREKGKRRRLRELEEKAKVIMV